MFVTLISAIDASVRQLVWLSAAFLIFMLLDHTLYAKLLRGLRLSLPFFAAYWLFATLFGMEFPATVVFTLRLLLLICVTVFCLGNLSLARVIADTRQFRKFRFGDRLIRYLLATNLYIRGYGRYFSHHKPRAGSNIGEVLDGVLGAGAHVLKSTSVVEAQLDYALKLPAPATDNTRANLIGISLLALLVLITSL